MLTAGVDGWEEDRQMAWSTSEVEDFKEEGNCIHFYYSLHLEDKNHDTEDIKVKINLNAYGIGDKVTVMFLINNTTDLDTLPEISSRSQSMYNLQAEGQNYSQEEAKRELIFQSTEVPFQNSSSSQNIHENLSRNDTNNFNDSLIKELFNSVIHKMTVVALPCTQMPSGSNMVKMLNISSFFKKFGYVEEYYESLFLTGLTMVSSRKYVQSVEFFRQIQKYIFNTLNDIPDEISKIDWNAINPYLDRDIQMTELESRSITSVFAYSSSTPEIKFRTLIRKAAKIEILIADCCSQHSQVQEKLDAFKNATLLYKINSLEMFRKIITPKSYKSLNKPYNETKMPLGQYIQEEDTYSELLKLQPNLLNWILSNLDESIEPIRISFLKALEFMLDTLGCSLGPHINEILGTVIKHVNISQIVKSKTKSTNSVFHQTLKNIYNHFLESFLSVLSSMSNQILLSLFDKVLYPALMQFKFDSEPGIFIYLLKITDKVINICKGDIELKSDVLTLIFEEVTKKDKNDTVNLAVKSLWQTILSNVFTNLTGEKLKNVIVWLSEQINRVKDAIVQAWEQETSYGSSYVMATKLFELVSLFAKQNSINLRDQSNVREGMYDLSADYSYHSKNDINLEFSLIKPQTKNSLDLEIYSLLSPMLFLWDYAVKKETRMNLFKPAWKGLIDLLDSLPIDTNTELIPIILPYLHKI